MTIDEILACEIPSSVYKLALIKLKQDINYFSTSSLVDAETEKPLVASLCTSFEVLYKIAIGEKADISLEMFCEREQIMHDEGKSKGRQQTIDNVLNIISYMSNVRPGKYLSYYYDSRTLKEFKSRIEALGEG